MNSGSPETDEGRGLSITWKNVQSLRSRGRQGELNAWLMESKLTILGVSETWLKGGEYLETDNKKYAWVMGDK